MWVSVCERGRRFKEKEKSDLLNQLHVGSTYRVEALKMGKSNAKHYLHITYICYTSLIIGWQRFNCISLLGVNSMELLHGNNEFTATGETENLSFTPIKSSENQGGIFSSVQPQPSTKAAIESSNLDFATQNAVDNSPIQGWECYCWNTTTGYEVKFNSI